MVMDESTHASNGSDFVQDEKLWLDDGNIIIRAGSGAGGANAPIHAFKCHKSVLKLNSTVFATLFEIPTSGNAKIDEVECVDLPEPWEDVRDLLWTLYGLFDPSEETSSLKITRHVAGCFRLSKKYDAVAVTKKSQTILDSIWPDTLEEWLALERARFDQLNKAQALVDDWETQLNINLFWPDPGPAVRLARETRTRSFFRAALYGLCRANVTPPTGGYSQMFDGPEFVTSILTTSPDYLGIEELWLLTTGRERIRNRANHLLLFHLPEVIERHCSVADWKRPGPGCGGDVRSCSQSLKRWICVDAAGGIRDLSVDPIWELALMQERLVNPGALGTDVNICSMCRGWFGEHLQHQIRLFWDWLPEAFDFEKLGLD